MCVEQMRIIRDHSLPVDQVLIRQGKILFRSVTAVPGTTSFPFWQVWRPLLRVPSLAPRWALCLAQTRKLRSWTRVRCCGPLSNKKTAPLELFGRIGLLDNLPVISIIYRVLAEWAGGSPNAYPTLPHVNIHQYSC